MRRSLLLVAPHLPIVCPIVTPTINITPIIASSFRSVSILTTLMSEKKGTVTPHETSPSSKDRRPLEPTRKQEDLRGTGTSRKATKDPVTIETRNPKHPITMEKTKESMPDGLQKAPAKYEVIFDKEELKKRLTPIQFNVTQEKGTEKPFSGEFCKLKDNGMYMCVVCGSELFPSKCKFKSGCGWPSFDDAPPGKVVYQADTSHNTVRTEVLCAKCGSHLGHLFKDGPTPTGNRFCINSASLAFKKDELKEESKPTDPVA